MSDGPDDSLLVLLKDWGVWWANSKNEVTLSWERGDKKLDPNIKDQN